MTKWVMVADASRARFFSAEMPRDGLSEIADKIHAKSRFHGRELETDAPSRTFNSVGPERHAIEPSTDVRELEAVAFARELSHYLGEAHGEGRYHQLYVIAPPHFLGVLRGQMGKAVSSAVVHQINKNLTKHPVTDIRAHLPTFM